MKLSTVLLMAFPFLMAGPAYAVGTCADGQDNDTDGWIDTADPDCTSETAIEKGFNRTYTCNDGVDNDGDTLIDGADADQCLAATDAESGNCADAVDNDGDGWIDLADPDCPVACTTCVGTELGFKADFTCNDGIDNDTDGNIDSADASCDDGMATEDGNCRDGNDNDGDGWSDAADPDCVAQCDTCDLNELGYEGFYACNDAEDNDGDGAIDAEDPDCESGTDNTESAGGPNCSASSFGNAGLAYGLFLLPLVGLIRRRFVRK